MQHKLRGLPIVGNTRIICSDEKVTIVIYFYLAENHKNYVCVFVKLSIYVVKETIRK